MRITLDDVSWLEEDAKDALKRRVSVQLYSQSTQASLSHEHTALCPVPARNCVHLIAGKE